MSLFTIGTHDQHPLAAARTSWRWLLRTSALAATIALASMTLAPSVSSASALADDKADKAKDVKTDQVELIFHSGRVIKGTLISETATEIKVKVTVAGMTAETTYPKADILTINRNLPVTDDTKKDDSKKEETDKPKDADDAKKPKNDGPTIYFLTLTGEFGRNVSKTSVSRLIEDIKKHEPDILLVRFDMEFARWGEVTPDFAPTADGQYDLLETARSIATYFTEDLMRDPAVKKKPRMVGWVKKALGGAAFLPFIFPELYYTSDGHHGGIGYLEHMFDGVGDDRAREKQYSLRLGRAEGMAAIGGYSALLVRAMSRTDYVLSYRMDGGKAVYIENQMPSGPSEFLLTDDGAGDNADTMQDILRFRGNDVLTLDAPTAERIGMSRGTADKLDDLVLKLGITREYNLEKGKSESIMKDWSKDVSKAEADVTRLIREYTQVEVREPGRYKQRTEARTTRKRLLMEVQSKLDKYGEAINPRRIQGMPADLIGQIKRVIYQIEQQQRLDRPD